MRQIEARRAFKQRLNKLNARLEMKKSTLRYTNINHSTKKIKEICSLKNDINRLNSNIAEMNKDINNPSHKFTDYYLDIEEKIKSMDYSSGLVFESNRLLEDAVFKSDGKILQNLPCNNLRGLMIKEDIYYAHLTPIEIYHGAKVFKDEFGDYEAIDDMEGHNFSHIKYYMRNKECKIAYPNVLWDENDLNNFEIQLDITNICLQEEDFESYVYKPDHGRFKGEYEHRDSIILVKIKPSHQEKTMLNYM